MSDEKENVNIIKEEMEKSKAILKRIIEEEHEKVTKELDKLF